MIFVLGMLVAPTSVLRICEVVRERLAHEMMARKLQKYVRRQIVLNDIGALPAATGTEIQPEESVGR